MCLTDHLTASDLEAAQAHLDAACEALRPVAEYLTALEAQAETPEQREQARVLVEGFNAAGRCVGEVQRTLKGGGG
jgi:hypothetical protein